MSHKNNVIIDIYHPGGRSDDLNHRTARVSLAAALAALAALAGALALSGCDQLRQGGGSAGEINFSIPSTGNDRAQAQLWKPFLDDMTRQTGLKIRPAFVSNATSIVPAMRSNRVQLGWFANFSALDAVRRGGGEVFAHATDPSGADGYNSVIIANAARPVTVERLLKCDHSLSFGMGDAKSISGSLAPLAYLFTPAGVDPQTCFKIMRSAGHQANLFAVANGGLDAAASNTNALQVLGRQRPDIAARVKVIWTSPTLPEDTIVWNRKLDPSTKEKLRSFFLSYGAAPGPEGEHQRAVLKALNLGVFSPADDSFLIPIRELEASEQLRAARRGHDAAGVKAAQAKLAAISQEKTASGIEGAATAPAAPESAPKPVGGAAPAGRASPRKRPL